MELCVLIPVYNNFSGLILSAKSICFDKENYLLVIVDDGSRVSVTEETVKKELGENVNVIVIQLATNAGITAALNVGLSYIYTNLKVRYIARLDCGDICHPQRFFRQIAFLETDKKIHLLGSWCYFKEKATGRLYKYATPTLDKSIRIGMYFRNLFIHPTVIWRISGTGQVYYPENYPCAEDYGLFFQMLQQVDAAIIPEFLVTCELNNTGISISKRSIQLNSRRSVIGFYGKNIFLFFLGAAKLLILNILPYKLIFFLKMQLFKAS